MPQASLSTTHSATKSATSTHLWLCWVRNLDSGGEHLQKFWCLRVWCELKKCICVIHSWITGTAFLELPVTILDQSYCHTKETSSAVQCSRFPPKFCRSALEPADVHKDADSIRIMHSEPKKVNTHECGIGGEDCLVGGTFGFLKINKSVTGTP